jgi:hypothetical protein
LSTITNDLCSQGNISLETCNNIGSLLLLIPTHSRIQAQDTDYDTKIDPVIQTSSK